MTEKEHAFVRAKMQKIGKGIEKEVPGFGFVVCVFPFGESDGNRMNYCSNACREEVVFMLGEFIERNTLPSKESNN